MEKLGSIVILTALLVLSEGATQKGSLAPGEKFVTTVEASGIATPWWSRDPHFWRSSPELPPIPPVEPRAFPDLPNRDDPRTFLLDTAAQQHRPGLPGLANYLGCLDCGSTGTRGISEARLAHAQ